MPAISVILPAFNASTTIAAAVQSILNQTVSDIELIVVDDGSDDQTSDVIRSFQDSRIQLIRQAHQGVAAAANRAFAASTAEFIARMDADDFAYPQRLERQLQWLTNEPLDVVGCQIRIVDPSGERVPGLRRYERWINTETLRADQISALRFVELPIVNPTIAARRSYFELGCRDDGFPEDYDLMLRASALGMRFGKVSEVLFDWIDRPDRLTRTDSRYSETAFMQCRRHHLLDGPLRSVREVDLWGVGQTGKSWLRWLQAHTIAVRQAYDVHPRKLGLEIHGVPVKHPVDMPDADGTPMLVAVGAASARAQIGPHLADRNYISGKDAWFVA